jgi:hypothetical protein
MFQAARDTSGKAYTVFRLIARCDNAKPQEWDVVRSQQKHMPDFGSYFLCVLSAGSIGDTVTFKLFPKN